MKTDKSSRVPAHFPVNGHGVPSMARQTLVFLLSLAITLTPMFSDISLASAATPSSAPGKIAKRVTRDKRDDRGPKDKNSDKDDAHNDPTGGCRLQSARGEI